MSNNLLRIITGVVGAPVVIGLLYLGGWPFGILVLIITLLAQLEFYTLAEAGGLFPYKAAGLALGLAAGLRPFWPEAGVAVVAASILLFVASPFFGGQEKPFERLSVTAAGIIYPTVFLSYLIDLREGRGPLVGEQEAFGLTLAVFVLIWVTDIFAYYTGRTIGKTPLAPSISPKKTVEGSVGGVIGAVLVAVVFRLLWLDFLPWVHVVALAFICGVISQFGDLAESRLKRAVGVKDSGNLLPGHGGMLDRFDAMIVAAPLVYLYLHYAAALYYPAP